MDESRPLPFHLLDFSNVVGDALTVGSKLLSSEEKQILRKYQQLPTDAQILSSRLYGRKKQWIRLSRLEDPDITNMIDAAIALKEAGLIKMYHPPDMSVKGAVPPSLPDHLLLSSLQAPELRQIAKSCDIQNSSTIPRDALLKSIKIVFSRKLPSGQQRLSFATGPPKSQRVALRMVAELVGSAVHLLPDFVDVLRVAHQLFLLQTPTQSAEFILMEQNASDRGHPPTVLLNGLRKWPAGRGYQQTLVFKTRQEFDDYQNAVKDLVTVTEAASKFSRQREEMTEIIEPILERHASYLEKLCTRRGEDHKCKLIEQVNEQTGTEKEAEVIICSSEGEGNNNGNGDGVTAATSLNNPPICVVDVDDDEESSHNVVVVSDTESDLPLVSPNTLVLDCSDPSPDSDDDDDDGSLFSFESVSSAPKKDDDATVVSDAFGQCDLPAAPEVEKRPQFENLQFDDSIQIQAPANEEFGLIDPTDNEGVCQQHCCECDHSELTTQQLNIFRKSYVSRLLLLEGVHPLESSKKYDPCIRYLRLILSCSRFKPRRRGRWWQRLVVDYGHLKQSDEALKVCRESLENGDNYFMAGSDRLWLERRFLRMSKNEKVVLPSVKGATKAFSTEVIQPTVNVVVGRKWRGSKWPMWDCASAIVRTSPADAPPPPLTERPPTLGNVEECAKQAICRKRGDGWTGRHCEGGTFQFIFVLLMWDSLFIPEVLPLKFQPVPIDFADPLFLSRLPEFTARSKEIESLSSEEVCQQIRDSYEAHKGISAFCCTWDSTPVDVLLEVASCLGPIRTGRLCIEFCSQMQLSGMPDLLLWNPISRDILVSEVKGPGDTLSTKQEIWLTRLTQLDIPCEVCRVIDADEEEKREIKEREKEEKRERVREQKEKAAAKKAHRRNQPKSNNRNSNTSNNRNSNTSNNSNAAVNKPEKVKRHSTDSGLTKNRKIDP
eukprot:TRINITY_DN15417_c0_g1_i1.p1 TRINITY_DN15417_c0_g1~~TRINITY_DN15417_c0_g1_i1.p1  ORF type:complete len:944 (+),score=193.72 TRINITY_DN15417_c0_g1_i1:48-2879(+)